MPEIYITKGKFPGIVDQLIKSYQVFGPVFQGQYHEFRQLQSNADADWDYQNTRLSPKGLLHPHSERMFQYSLAKDDPQAGILQEIQKDYPTRVILGIRPCDARAFQLDDRNFDTSTIKDPWWVKRRQSTILVGLGCNEPCSTCFCTSVGTGPFDATGLDVLLTDVKSAYVMESFTEKGERLVAELGGGSTVTKKSAKKKADVQKAANKKLSTLFDVRAIAQQPMLDLFNASFWDEVQFSCINCGTCTFLCPTCWCFDIQDEVHQDQGERIRIWDSCMFPLFTLHGSGHNPRSQKLQRVRQRFMHKLKYYQDKYHNGVACVGCGRCVRSCPVNIDIRQVVQLMSASCTCPA